MNTKIQAKSAASNSYVLCAFDLGENSDKVVKNALQFSHQFDLPIMVLCSYRLLQLKASEEVPAVKKRYEHLANEKIKHISKVKPEIKNSFRSEIGFLSDRIESFMKEEKVSFLVIGNETASSIYEQKGQSLKEFICKVNVPVVVIPE